MPIGFPVTKADLDGKLGRAALRLKQALDDFEAIKAYTDAYSAEQLEALLGYEGGDPGEGDVIKSALADAAALKAAYEADYDSWIPKLYGLGIE